jgi:hypothetical protein
MPKSWQAVKVMIAKAEKAVGGAEQQHTQHAIAISLLSSC